VNQTLLIVLALAFGLITIYFCWRYYLRRRLPSLVCAVMPIGWIAAFGLQIERLQKEWLPLLFLAGLSVAGVSLYIIINHEMGRDQPFR
jgi:FtsH-binding integral membrane protein